MVKLELLSDNLVLIINKLLENDNLCKLIYYNSKNPYNELPISNKNETLMLTKIFPYPFNEKVETELGTQLHIFYPELEIQNNVVVEEVVVFVDIIVGKTLWLINDGQPKVRPYEIAKEIVNIFHDKSIDTLGQLDFFTIQQLNVNNVFSGIRLIGGFDVFSSGK